MCFLQHFYQVDSFDEFPLFSMSFIERPKTFALEVLAALTESTFKVEISIPANPKTPLTQRAIVAVKTGLCGSI